MNLWTSLHCVPAAGGSCPRILWRTASTGWWTDSGPAGHRCSSASPRLSPPGRSASFRRVGAPGVSGHRAQRAGEPELRQPGSPWCERWDGGCSGVCVCVCVCVCVTVLFVMEPRLRSNAFILKGLTGSVVSLLFLTSHVVMLNCSRLLPPAATQRNYNGLILNKTN